MERSRPSDYPQDLLNLFDKYVHGAIDKATSTVTLKGKDGNPFTIKAKKKETLDKVKVGDLIVFTAMKSVATSVEKGAK